MKVIRDVFKRKSAKIAFILLVFIFIGILYAYEDINKNNIVTEEEAASEETFDIDSLIADLNGNGEKERVVLEMPEDEFDL